MSMRFPLLVFSMFVSVSASTGQTEPFTPTQFLDAFIGEWEGTATAWYPREDGRPPREETVRVTCRPVLNGTYVECHSVWTTGTGTSRELLTFWNYDQEVDSVNILFLYDNWAGKVLYPLSFDPESRELRGYDTFTASGNIPAEERVSWHLSGDLDTIQGTAFIHYQTDPEDYRPQSFRFVLKRKR